MANNDMLKYGDGKNKNKQKTLTYKPKDTKMLTTYITAKGNEYPIWKDASTGQYYIIDKTGKRSNFSNQKAINLINQNKPMCISKESYGAGKYSNKSGTPVGNVEVNTGGGGGGYTPSYGGYSDNTGDLYNRLLEQIEQIQHPKEWTVDELAEHFGVKDYYDLNYLLSTYDNATNKYYTDAIDAQIKDNDEALRNSSYYANNLLNEYLRSYNNTAPTSIGKSTLAANTIKSMFGADQANEEAASNLNSIVESYREAWKAALEDNKLKARDEYNDLGNFLLQGGLNLNTSQVQNYVNQLEAAAKAYTGIRNAQSTLASDYANAYQSALQGALTTNAYSASQAGNNLLRNAYQQYYSHIPGVNWETVYNNANRDTAITYSDKASKN